MTANLHPKSRQKIAPWHTQLGAFFLYPMRPAVLPALVLLTFCSMISGYLSVLGLFIAIAATLTAYKFAFEILSHHSNGWEEPPEAMMTVRDGLVFRYLIVLMVVGAFYWVIDHYFGSTAGFVVLAVFCLIQPGYTMLAVIEGSVLSAINPAKWLRLMQILGNGYFLLAILLLSGQLLETWLSNNVFSFMPNIIATAIVKILSLWVLFTSAYWMGYLIYQYHRELGFEPDAYGDQAIRALDRDGMLLQAIDIAMANEQYDEAIERMKYESRERVPGIALHAKFRELLVKKGDVDEIRLHAKTFLHQLLTEKNLPRALSLAIQQFSIDPDFIPLDGETTDTLAKEARRVGQVALERKLLISLLANFPDETMTGDWAVRLSELLRQSGETTSLAMELLNAATAATRSENQRQRLQLARETMAAN